MKSNRKFATYLVSTCFVGMLTSPGVASAQDMTAQTSSDGSSADGYGEIVVTAQKRDERLIDVPASVSVIGGERLETLNVTSISDMASYIPGVTVSSGGSPGARQIVLRGISTDFNPGNAPTVATYVDDMPIGPSGGGLRAPTFGLDLMPYDIESIEVLKGPQGTLYGSNAMGGLVKYVLKKPDLNEVEARAGGDVETITHSGRPSWSVRGAFGAPIIADKLAVRVSGFYRSNAGYLDNVASSVLLDDDRTVVPGIRNANGSTQQGIMGSILWQPTETLSIKAFAALQDIHADNLSEVQLNATTLEPIHGRYAFSRLFPETFDQRVRVYNLSADLDLGFGTLTSSTGFSRVHLRTQSDLSGSFGAVCAPTATNPGCVDYPFADSKQRFVLNIPFRQFVQEVRLASKSGGAFEWLIGGLYSSEDGTQYEDVSPYTPALARLASRNDLYHHYADSFTSLTQKAVFANLTYRFSDSFDVGGGIRYSSYTIDQPRQIGFGVLFGAASFTTPATISPPARLENVGVTTWTANARFHPSPDSTLYARVATGYRPGSGCPTCGNAALQLPGVVDPDRTTNYEVGFKGNLFDRRLLLDMALFYIDWTKIQVTGINALGLRYNSNAGKARSQGFELSAAYRINEGLKVNGTLAYTDAQLTEDAPGVNGRKGDQLPASARWSGSAALDYDGPIDGNLSLIAGASYRYRSRVLSLFEHAPNSYPTAAFGLIDAYAGVRFDKVTARLYIKNLLNEEAYSGLLYLDMRAQPQFIPVQPRTIGLSLDLRF